jgi:hypothetical protein
MIKSGAWVSLFFCFGLWSFVGSQRIIGKFFVDKKFLDAV